MSRLVAVAMLLITLAGCAAHQRPLSGPNLAVLPLAELPPPSEGARDYHLGPFDTVEIDVYGVPELARREIQADAGGRLSYPLVGVIEAKGMTLAELSATITERLRARYIRDPQVTVNLKEAVSQTVTVDGEVREPGVFPVVGEMSLMQAIARAKGTTEYAKLDEVVVFRTVGDQRMAALYNLGAIRNGVYKDPAVYPQDVIVVGDSPSRRLFQKLLTLAPLVTTPLVLLLQN